MTDAAYCFSQDERARKSLARQSRYKKNGSRTNYVRLPQTYMTEKEIRKMHGEIVTVSFGKRYTKEEFLKFDDDMRRLYIQNLIDKYNARRKDIANMLGLSYGGFAHMCQKLFPSNPFKNEGKGAKPTREWLDFASGKLEEPKPVEDFLPPPEVIIKKKPPLSDDAIKDMEKAAVKVNDATVLEHLSVRLNGKIAMAFEKVFNMVDADKDYVINIELYQPIPLACDTISR